MKLQHLSIRDFRSIEYADVVFEGSGLTLVDGFNYDMNSANGAGKTSLISAICYCLYGKIPQKVSVSEIPRRGASACVVEAEFERSSNRIKIIRTKPTKFELFINDIKEVADQSTIDALMGLNYDQFCLVVYQPQGQSQRLLSINDTAKKDFLMSVVGIDSLQQYKDLIDSKIKTVDIEVSKISAEITRAEASINAYRESVVAEDDLVTVDCQPVLKKIAELEGIKQPDMHKYHELEAGLQEEYEILVAKRADIKNQRTLLSKQRSDRSRDINAHKECPSCGAGLIVRDGHVHLSSDYVAGDFSDIDDALLRLEESIASTEREISENRATLSKLNAKKQELSSVFIDAQARLPKLYSLLKQQEIHNNGIADVKANNAKLLSKISDLSEHLDSLNSSLVSKRETKSNLELLKQSFSPAGLPAYILDSALDTFNDRVNWYLSRMWPGASFSLLSYKENKQGDIRAKISESLALYGDQVSVGALSGGEFKCLSLVVDFAVADLVELFSQTSIDFMVLDEAFDGLDALNRERIFDLLEIVGQSREILVIDHASEIKSMFSRVLFLEKRNRVSRLI